jgi:predicted RNase H-like HicB family nuclease
MSTSVRFEIFLPVKFRKEGRYMVAWCFPLDVYSQGETLEKAKENIREAVQLFLMDCFKRGTLEKVLKDCGFIPIKRPSLGPVKPKENEISVPLPFVIDQELAKCHA